MGYKVLWFSAAALLISGSVAAEPFRYRPQPELARAWVIDGDGLFLEEARKPRRAIKLPDWKSAGAPYACAPDIAIGPRGEAVVTSNVLPVLWKIDPDSLAVSMHRLQLDADTDKDVGFSGITYSARNGAYFAVSEHHGSLWRIDPLLRRAQKVAVAVPMHNACAVSIERQQRASPFSRLCVHGKGESWLVHLAADQRSAYVQATGCSTGSFAEALPMRSGR
jgi:hypothetical protein